MRRLRERIDSEPAHAGAGAGAQPKNAAVAAPGKAAKRAKAGRPKQPLTEAEFDQHLQDIGFLNGNDMRCWPKSTEMGRPETHSNARSISLH
jgi:hypothetical protein